MEKMNEYILLDKDQLEKEVSKTQDGRIFWDSYKNLIGKEVTIGQGLFNAIPIFLKIDAQVPRYYGKMVYLTADSTEVNLYDDLYEADSLLLLLVYLVKKDLCARQSNFKISMTLSDMVVSLSDQKILTKERVRQRLIMTLKSLDLHLKNIYDKEI